MGRRLLDKNHPSIFPLKIRDDCGIKVSPNLGAGVEHVLILGYDFRVLTLQHKLLCVYDSPRFKALCKNRYRYFLQNFGRAGQDWDRGSGLAFPLLATVVTAEPKLINHVKQNITRLVSPCYFWLLEPLEAIISCSCRSYLITVHRRSIASSPSFPE